MEISERENRNRRACARCVNMAQTWNYYVKSWNEGGLIYTTWRLFDAIYICIKQMFGITIRSYLLGKNVRHFLKGIRDKRDKGRYDMNGKWNDGRESE